MPLYEYQCEACGRRVEIIQQKFSDPPPEACTACGKGPVTRLASSPAIQFKGSGFYITDYAKKGEAGKSDKTSTEKTQDAKSDAAKSEGAKTEGAKTDGAKTDGAKTDGTAKTETPGKSDAPAAAKPSSTIAKG